MFRLRRQHKSVLTRRPWDASSMTAQKKSASTQNYVLHSQFGQKNVRHLAGRTKRKAKWKRHWAREDAFGVALITRRRCGNKHTCRSLGLEWRWWWCPMLALKQLARFMPIKNPRAHVDFEKSRFWSKHTMRFGDKSSKTGDFSTCDYSAFGAFNFVQLRSWTPGGRPMLTIAMRNNLDFNL